MNQEGIAEKESGDDPPQKEKKNHPSIGKRNLFLRRGGKKGGHLAVQGKGEGESGRTPVPMWSSR